MRSRAAIVAAVACVAIACSVGQGQGTARGAVVFPDCRLNNPNYDLRPDFFAADFANDPVTTTGPRRQILQIRVQRGSYGEWASDGLSILVRDVDPIARALAAGSAPTAIPIGTDQQVEMTLYLGESCPSGFPSAGFYVVPAILSAVRGTITFTAIYAPDVAPNAIAINAHFDGVRFEDGATPTTRSADLNGSIAFYYQRGRPAQHFP